MLTGKGSPKNGFIWDKRPKHVDPSTHPIDSKSEIFVPKINFPKNFHQKQKVVKYAMKTVSYNSLTPQHPTHPHLDLLSQIKPFLGLPLSIHPSIQKKG